MDSLFGLSMNAVLVAMLILLGISLCTVVYVVLRHRIMFAIGVRNIPRRLAQTVLIIVGLMLSTLIISAAFATGDTVDHSVTKEIYRLFGHVDEFVAFESQGDTPAPDVSIPLSAFETLDEELKGDEDIIDGRMPAIAEDVVVIDPEQRQSAPSVNFLGLDETRLESFPDLTDDQGNLLDVAALGRETVTLDEALAEDMGLPVGTNVTANEVFINKSLADELNTVTGSILTVRYENQPYPIEVSAIVQDRGISGSFGGDDNEGMVAGLATVRQMFSRPDEIDIILISNTGDTRTGVSRTDDVEARIEEIVEQDNLQLGITVTKAESLDQAELAGNAMMTFFLIFGMFSIAAGILLIVMIFVMLAAERKSELGMARALGTKRWHLVESFLSEGMGYNLISALVGVALGVAVAFALVGVLAQVFAGTDAGFSIEPYVSARSLIISYSLGVVLTFLTVSFSSWRVSRLNIVRAIRDIPEPTARPSGRGLIVALLLIPVAAFFIWVAFPASSAFLFGLGLGIGCFAAGMLSRQARLPERLSFTAIGIFLLIFWAAAAGGRVPGLTHLNGGPELFVLSGIMMVAAASYVLVYNADLLLAVVSLAGNRLGRLLPAFRMAVAYPLASKFRTGMTLAMIALVVFALTMMSMMNTNFDQVFLNDENFGGWEVEVRENSNNPLAGGLEEALETSEEPADTSDFDAIGSIGIATLFGAELCQPDEVDCTDDEEFRVYMVKGANEPFLDHTTLPLQARAEGYANDGEVWQAIAKQPSLAVIDVLSLGGDFFDFGAGDFFRMKGLEPDVTTFDSITLEVRDSASGNTEPVQVIGILNTGASGGGDPSSSFFGLITSLDMVNRVFGEAESSNYYVSLADPDQAEAVAADIESALLTSGAQASSLKKDREEDSALFNSFFYLMQAFAGLGLFVGIAAVGVVAFRSVVERRQQIGMLRAVGFTRGAVAISFAIESLFISLLGVAAGIGLAVLLATFLLTSEEFETSGITAVIIPWAQIATIGVFALAATLLMTLVPSRQAASVPIAEALRYE
ncbi:MAG: FtsX-like permease family protein [Dehalococcoidia bacterium]